MLPVLAQMTTLAPFFFAIEMAVVIPRSLNDPVGLSPSYLTWTLAPVSSERRSHGMSGVPPSWRVTTGSAAQHRQPVGVLADHPPPQPGHRQAPSTRMTEMTSSTVSRSSSASTVAASAASGAAWVTTMRLARDVAAVGDDVLADGLDRHVVLGERRRDLGEHARSVGDVEADVVAGHRLAHVGHGKVGVGRLAGSAAAGHLVPGHGDDVAEDGRGGRVTTGAASVEHELAGGRRPRRTRR